MMSVVHDDGFPVAEQGVELTVNKHMPLLIMYDFIVRKQYW